MFFSKVLLLALMGTSSFARLSQPTTVEDLTCRVTAMAMKIDDSTPGEEMYYMCETIDEQDPTTHGMMFSLSLPEDFVDQHPELDSGDTLILIPKGKAVVSPDPLVAPYVEYPSGARISIVERRRNLIIRPHQRAQGVKSLLVVRVTSLDSDTLPAESLSGRVFGIGDEAEEVNVVTQFNDCSYGKMQVQPAEGPGIVNGVAEVFLPLNTTQTSATAYEAQLASLVNNTDQYDHIMYCLPEGSISTLGRSFIAFAYVSNPNSWYNGKWCGSISAIMHELGHNIGLRHSGIAGNHEYADVSGYMGFGVSAVGYPAMCFNGFNHWIMGWYDDRRVELNGNRAWTGHLDALTDYDSSNAGDDSVVVMKVGDYYLQYNRAEKFNVETRLAANEITIVQADGNGRTQLVDTISLDSSVFSIDDFNGLGHTMVIEACSHEFGDPDRFTLSVHLEDGQQQSYCRGGMQSIEAPTGAPSEVPSYSSQAPTATPMPTATASASPSQSPSIFTCEDEDDSTRHFRLMDGSYGGCPLLRHQAPEVIAAHCVPGHIAYERCEETCGLCTDGCHDSSEDVVINERGVKRSCAWISRYAAWVRRVCQPGQEAYTKCGETCNTCEHQNEYIAPSSSPSAAPSSETCEDSWTETFFVDASPRWQADRTCVWLSRSVAWKRLLCVPEHPAYHACPELCGKCQDSCGDDETFTTFVTAKHQFQGCHWMSIRPAWADLLCQRPEVADACRETCDTCSAEENKALP